MPEKLTIKKFYSIKFYLEIQKNFQIKKNKTGKDKSNNMKILLVLKNMKYFNFKMKKKLI